METSTGRLSLAPDGYSETRPAERPTQTKEKPRCSPRCATTEERGRTTHTSFDTSEGVAVMAKRTRITGRSDSGTQQTGVNITPPTQCTGPVTTTCSTR